MPLPSLVPPNKVVVLSVLVFIAAINRIIYFRSRTMSEPFVSVVECSLWLLYVPGE
jgi:hypothetical protein